jgi:hypothetical protein
MGDKVSTDASEKIKAKKHGYDWDIEVNDYEHYTVPEAVISGGEAYIDCKPNIKSTIPALTLSMNI